MFRYLVMLIAGFLDLAFGEKKMLVKDVFKGGELPAAKDGPAGNAALIAKPAPLRNRFLVARALVLAMVEHPVVFFLSPFAFLYVLCRLALAGWAFAFNFL